MFQKPAGAKLQNVSGNKRGSTQTKPKVAADKGIRFF
jgi:hypothetical protein